jgi:hypothetical protein
MLQVSGNAGLHKVHCANNGAWKNSHLKESKLAQKEPYEGMQACTKIVIFN